MTDILRDGEALASSPQYQTLLGVAEALVSHRDWRTLFADLARRLHRAVPFDCVCLRLHDSATDTLRLHAREAPDAIPPPAAAAPAGEHHPAVWVWQTQQALVVSNLAEERRWPRYREQDREGVRSLCLLPLTTARGRLGTLAFGRVQAATYDHADLAFLRQVANLVAVAVENALAFDIRERCDAPEREKVSLEEEVGCERDFEAIIGESAALVRVLKEVETVAPTNTTVLIRGETGTGKELIAHALHQLSPRREGAFVKINCAAIPTGLLESELFGHEKGAFTGAVAQKVGRFELADGGTLFLDEVGDISLELQPKLLRVLQDQEFERLGGTRTLRVDVRLVAATNRDLPRMVGQGHFRGDLYYRLNVFPVILPPLRERREDIPQLARTFTQRFARRLGKRIEAIPAEAMAVLVRYDWPGNVRELENVIERAVILSTGPALRIPLAELQTPAVSGEQPETAAITLEDFEREHIICILREANWVLGGPVGAAVLLGVTRSSLHRKLKKLGISRPG